MRVNPVEPGEVSCRNCAHFNFKNVCWQDKDACGFGLPKFKEKNNDKKR